MRKLALASLVVVSSIAAACGGSDEPAPTTDPAVESLSRGSTWLVRHRLVPLKEGFIARWTHVEGHIDDPGTGPTGPTGPTDPGSQGGGAMGGMPNFGDLFSSLEPDAGGAGLGNPSLSGGLGRPELSGGLGSLDTGGIASEPAGVGFGGLSPGPLATTAGGFANADLAAAVCDFFVSFCDWIAGCLEGVEGADGILDEACGELAGPACAPMIQAALDEAGAAAAQIPPGAADVFRCLADDISTIGCDGSGAESFGRSCGLESLGGESP